MLTVAVLSEGPESKICGLPGTEAKLYPTRDLKGVVFVWMGDEAPALIEEDVPEEFFHADSVVMYNDRIYWDTNWAIALENYLDAHFSYLHRDNIQSLLSSLRHSSRATPENVILAAIPNGFTYAAPETRPPPNHDYYPNGWKWRKHRFRRQWAWFFVPIFSLTRVPTPPSKDPEWWGPDLRLPAMTRTPGMFVDEQRFGLRRPPRTTDPLARGRGGEIDPNMVLPLHQAPYMGPTRMAQISLLQLLPVGRGLQLLLPGRERDAEPTVGYAGDVGAHGFWGGAVAETGGHEALRRARPTRPLEKR